MTLRTSIPYRLIVFPIVVDRDVRLRLVVRFRDRRLVLEEGLIVTALITLYDELDFVTLADVRVVVVDDDDHLSVPLVVGNFRISRVTEVVYPTFIRRINRGF